MAYAATQRGAEQVRGKYQCTVVLSSFIMHSEKTVFTDTNTPKTLLRPTRQTACSLLSLRSGSTPRNSLSPLGCH